VISFNRMQSLVELIREIGEFVLKLAYDKQRIGESALQTVSERSKSVLQALLDVVLLACGADVGLYGKDKEPGNIPYRPQGTCLRILCAQSGLKKARA